MELAKRSNINFIVDALAFSAFIFLTSTGVLLHFLLPPGSGAQKSIWGFTRHQWGDVHLTIAFTLVGIVVLHLLLHWKWIAAIIRGRVTQYSRVRAVIGLLVALTLVGIAISPILSPIEVSAPGDHQQGRMYRGGQE